MVSGSVWSGIRQVCGVVSGSEWYQAVCGVVSGSVWSGIRQCVEWYQAVCGVVSGGVEWHQAVCRVVSGSVWSADQYSVLSGLVTVYCNQGIFQGEERGERREENTL